MKQLMLSIALKGHLVECPLAATNSLAKRGVPGFPPPVQHASTLTGSWQKPMSMYLLSQENLIKHDKKKSQINGIFYMKYIHR